MLTLQKVYLLHAYDYCREDPMICLSLSIASLGRAMQRQSDNRHHLITQVIGLTRLYELLELNDLGDGISYTLSDIKGIRPWYSDRDRVQLWESISPSR